MLNETPWRITHHNDVFAVTTEFESEEVKEGLNIKRLY